MHDTQVYLAAGSLAFTGEETIFNDWYHRHGTHFFAPVR